MQQKRLENLMFVYGTLKAGFWNDHFLHNSTYIGEGETLGKHRMISLGGFPGVIWCGRDGYFEKGTAQIKGEVYQVNDPEIRARIDALEGYPNFYTKQSIWTDWGKATMYILSQDFLKKGDYMEQETIDTGEWTQ